jgi:hypothetical protein
LLRSAKINKVVEGSNMKDFFKAMLISLAVTSAFLLGLHLGRSKEKAKIPNFQEDLEDRA